MANVDSTQGQNGSLLAELGALRARREAETTTDIALPGFDGRLWATVRLPRTEKATQVQAFMLAGQAGLLGACMDLIAYSTAGLYMASPDAESPIRDKDGTIRRGFRHLPGGVDEMPITFDARLEGVPELCPPLAGGRPHTPETRVRSLFARDSLVTTMAMLICGWALGGGDTQGALNDLSAQFVGESKGDPT